MKIIPTSITNGLARHILVAQKNSPKVLFVAGIAGVVGSTFLACRATLKLSEKLEDFTYDIEQVKGMKTDEIAPAPSAFEYNKELAYVYAKNTLELTKLYAPAVILGSLSIGALTTSHVTLTRRNASLTAAYSALQMSFDAYRDRVRKEVGVNKELDIRHSVEEIDNPDGKGKLKVVGDKTYSPYARFFDEGCPDWQKNPEYNRLFLKCQQTYLNDLLHARGHVFLNEVYDRLGIERTPEGQVVGWVANSDGDNFIDFGIFEGSYLNELDFYEPRMLLDFNVDGVIWDKI